MVGRVPRLKLSFARSRGKGASHEASEVLVTGRLRQRLPAAPALIGRHEEREVDKGLAVLGEDPGGLDRHEDRSREGVVH